MQKLPYNGSFLMEFLIVGKNQQKNTIDALEFFSIFLEKNLANNC
jgi:hypothetical protein